MLVAGDMLRVGAEQRGVDSWACVLISLPPVGAFVLGAGMFRGYEGF
jgi:hypothetical protein